MFARDSAEPAVVIAREGGRMSLVGRTSFLPRYLHGYSRDIFQRRPITEMLDMDHLGETLIIPGDVILGYGSEDSRRLAAQAPRNRRPLIWTSSASFVKSLSSRRLSTPAEPSTRTGLLLA
jgi:hypothetical protein